MPTSTAYTSQHQGFPTEKCLLIHPMFPSLFAAKRPKEPIRMVPIASPLLPPSINIPMAADEIKMEELKTAREVSKTSKTGPLVYVDSSMLTKPIARALSSSFRYDEMQRLFEFHLDINPKNIRLNMDYDPEPNLKISMLVKVQFCSFESKKLYARKANNHTHSTQSTQTHT